jgi:hypothetical protein
MVPLLAQSLRPPGDVAAVVGVVACEAEELPRPALTLTVGAQAMRWGQTVAQTMIHLVMMLTWLHATLVAPAAAAAAAIRTPLDSIERSETVVDSHCFALLVTRSFLVCAYVSTVFALRLGLALGAYVVPIFVLRLGLALGA